MSAVIPACQGDARFDDEDQALYVARGHAHEFGGRWITRRCGEHWHVVSVESDHAVGRAADIPLAGNGVVFDVDGEPVRLCGVPDGATWTPEARAALTELVRAARAKYLDDVAADDGR